MRQGKREMHNLQDILMLSPMQEGILYHYLENPESEQYFEQLCLRVTGDLHIIEFEQAWNFVIQANEMLRVVFRWKKLERPVQVVLHEQKVSISLTDLTELAIEEQETQLTTLMVRERKIPFDLEIGPLLRIHVCKLAAKKYAIILSFHHIIWDGWSTGIILQEVFRAYTNLMHGKKLIQPEKNRFKEYLRWLKNRNSQQEMDYWREYLLDLDSQTMLPVDYLQYEDHTHVASYDLHLPDHLFNCINNLSKELGVTVQEILSAAWGILLQKYNQANDVIYGVTVSGRPAMLPGIEEIVGLFINTIPVRLQFLKDITIAELLTQMHQDAIRRKEFEYTPLVEIKKLSQLEPGTPLFDSILVMETYPLEQLFQEIDEFALHVDNYTAFEVTNFDLTLVLTLATGLHIKWIYKENRFTKETIIRLGEIYEHILNEMLHEPNLRKIADIKLLSSKDSKLILEDFNPCVNDYSEKTVIMQTFVEMLEKQPHSPAVIFKEQELTYLQLASEAIKVATVLREHGVAAESIIGLLVEPSIEMVSGIFGTLLAGGAYVPIDPRNPLERIQYMLSDCGTKILLTQSKYIEQMQNLSEKLIIIDLDNIKLKNIARKKEKVCAITKQFVNEINPSDLAYIIYTSGSTGKPKGVLVEHHSLMNLLVAMQREYPLNHDDTWLLKTPYTFDVSLTELFGWILGGGRLAILEPEGEKEPRKIIEAIKEYQVTHLNFVPSMYTGFMDYVELKSDTALQPLKYLMVAGEPISIEQVKRLYQLTTQVEFINLYGPTEATVYASHFALKQFAAYRSVPIGKGFANSRLYVIGKDNNFQPIGFPGELCIAGGGLSRGYLNYPELTKEKFIEHPLVGSIYKTGDLVRWLPDGNIDFLGRLDHQVKIRGYRIEIGEIENKLLNHQAVKEAIVLARENMDGQKSLCAYLVTEEDVTSEALKNHLAASLPAYMIPANFVFLSELPLTSNGKINRKALPAPDEARETQYVAPLTVLETQLVTIWQELLESKRVGITDNFFTLGGHSIKAVQVTARIYKEIGVEVSVRELFTTLTIERLAALIEQRQKEQVEQKYFEIELQPKQAYYPVSSAQKRLYLLNQLNPESLAYNMPMAFSIDGTLNVERFDQIMHGLVQRHEALRTGFEQIDGELVQHVWEQVELKIEYAEYSIDDFDTFIQPFDLAQAPLLRIKLSKVTNERHLLYLDMHHIISDGRSLEIFIEEFTKAYAGETLSELRLQYRDFTIWQNHYLSSDKLDSQEKYWLTEFAGELPTLNLPTDYTRPAIQDWSAEHVKVSLSQETTKLLHQMAKEKGATLFMVLLSCYNILLAKYSGDKDIIVGTPVNGRSHPDLQKIIGMFVNTLAIRSQPMGEKTFAEYLTEIKEKVLQGFENQDYQFEMLVDKLNLQRDLNHNPLFDVVFVQQDISQHEKHMQLPGLDFHYLRSANTITKFDLTLLTNETPTGLDLHFEYAAKLFKRDTIEHMAEHLRNLISNVVTKPEVQIMDIEICSPEEKELLLSGFNATESEYPQDKTIPQLFTEQVTRTPGRIAVRLNDVSLTYRELYIQANQLAHLLHQQGVQPDQVIGLMGESSLELIIGILGILSAGGAYLPIDPTLPIERIQFMLQDAEIRILLTEHEQLKAKAKEFFTGEILSIQELLKEQDRLTDEFENIIPLTAKNLAYIMYTSGSTGQPKGVMIPHQGIVRLIFDTSCVQRTEDEIFLQISTFSFDASTYNIWGALLFGGRLVLVPKETLHSYHKLAELIQKEQITNALFTTAFFNQLIDELPDSLKGMRYIYIGGEAMSVPHMRKAFQSLPNTLLINGYGPTESTTLTTLYPLKTLPEGRSIPIGKPIHNTRVYILDQYHKLVPLGGVGELYIAGDGLARGYLNRKELTEERFIENPYQYGDILYKSGDLVRYLPDGNLEFYGRKDQQIKLRGFRIELGELEATLLKQPNIKNVYLQVKTDKNNDKYLIAYLVMDEELIVEELRHILIQTLPEYMLPNVFIKIPEMPLTLNGKVDWRALPEPTEYLNTNTYVAPRNEIEVKLTHIFAEVLGVAQVGIHDNFFTLGGHSLKATQVIARIAKELHVEIPFRVLFKTPVIEDLARLIAKEEKQLQRIIIQQPEQEYYPVSSAQKRIYLLQQMGIDQTGYNIPICMWVKGTVDRKRFEQAFETIITRHESLRTVFPQVNGEPVQRILREIPFTIVYSVLDTNLPDNMTTVIQSKFQQFVQPFSLEKAPLLRIELVEVTKETHLLFLDIHHIIADGLSMNNLIKEFTLAYGGQELPTLKLQYRDFTIWQNEFLQSEDIHRQETYWLTEFAGDLPVLDLPTDQKRPAIQSYTGDSLDFTLSEEVVAKLKQLAEMHGATLNVILLAIYKLLLTKYTGQDDLIVGMPIAGRWHDDLAAMIGMFVNTLAIRSQPISEKRFTEYLHEVREKIYSAQDNQDYQFEMLVERLTLERDLSRNPLFDTVFSMQNMIESTQLEVEELQFTQVQLPSQIAKFDLMLSATEESNALNCRVDYCTKLFRKETIAQMIRHFEHLVEEVLNHPEKQISAFEMISQEEKHKLIYTWNETEVALPKDQTLAELFEAQVAKTPAKVAVRFDEQTLTYQQLNERANQLAWALLKRGVKPDQLVALMLERSLEMIIGMIGILKAGGAYLPIDPDLPVMRKKYILEDARSQILLTQGHMNLDFLQEFTQIDVLDLTQTDFLTSYSVANPPISSTPQNLAYVIYTSGSTGQPKGVLIEQHGIPQMFYNNDFVTLGEETRVLQASSYNFDASVIDFCSSLHYGGELILVKKEDLLSGRKLADILIKEKITFCLISPVLFNKLIDEAPDGLSGVKQLMVAGDVISVPHTRKALQLIPNTMIVNGYGPTETTVLATVYHIKEVTENCKSIPIGRPITNQHIYILDKHLNLVAPGVIGEIYIGGEGMARGYLNRHELTKEKFIPNPLREGETIYRSGDLGRYLPDGNIEFYGRIDHQVKLRGLRIELGEIETALAQYPEVKEAIVLVKGENLENKYLVGYYTAEQEVNISALRAYLLKSLPDYMVPTSFMHLSQFPLTSTGKIDRNKLPEPAKSQVYSDGYIAPRNEFERGVAAIYAEVLGIEQVGAYDQFFALGGHSLKASQVIALIAKRFNVELPLRELFQHSVVAELAQIIANHEEKQYTIIERQPTQSFYPVSSAQKRIFILTQLDVNNTVYNMPLAMKIYGSLNYKRLEAAFKQLVQRHESLRTEFVLQQGEPVQRVKTDADTEITLTTITPTKIESKLCEFVRPFDLSKAPLLRIELVKLAEQEHLLLLDLHHIIADGFSMDIILNEFIKLYEGEELQALRIQYRDFAVWQNRLLSSEVGDQLKRYWLKVFAGEIPVLNLPLDEPRPAVQNYAGAHLDFILSSEMLHDLKELAQKLGVTLYMLLFTAYNILLARYSGQDDIIVGSPVAGRHHPDVYPLIGMFVNTLALRTAPMGDKTVVEFIQEVKDTVLLAIEHQDYPFELLIDQLQVERNLSRNPLFDTVFTLHNIGEGERQIELTGLSMHEYLMNYSKSKFDLTLSGREINNELSMNLNYATSLFTKSTMERLAKHYENILESMLADPEQRIVELRMLNQNEQEQILIHFNETYAEFPLERTVDELVTAWALQTPNAEAITQGTENLTFAELNKHANALAVTLRKYGVKADEVVGLMAERSVDLIIGMLGIIKAGGAYLPINPEYPAERIEYMLTDSNARLLLTQPHLQERIHFSGDMITLAKVNETNITEAEQLIEPIHTSQNLAYIIYTSGSTGKPKAVMIEHKSLTNFLYATYQNYQKAVGPGDRCLSLCNISFDVNVFETWLPLVFGATLVLYEGQIIFDVDQLAKTLIESSITMAYIPPTLLKDLSQCLYKKLNANEPATANLDFQLNKVLVGVEPIKDYTLEDLLKLNPNMQIINGYGPTEATICATNCIYQTQKPVGKNISIGQPLQNLQVVLVDKNQQLVPIGVPGELCISGVGLARGYLHRPELTKDKFVQNPFCPNQRMYRTGDLARWLPDGNIEFLGRIDYQVKIRGHRIEPGEIETQLLTLPELKEAVVIAKDSTDGTKYLAAYYVAEREMAVGEICSHLLKQLPDYMVPSYFIQLSELPLTQNGKINRSVLPEPVGRIQTGKEFIAPRNEVEEKLAVIWRNILELEQVSINETFFELGGNSLRLIKVFEELKIAFPELELTVADLFTYNSIEQLAEQVQSELTNTNSEDDNQIEEFFM